MNDNRGNEMPLLNLDNNTAENPEATMVIAVMQDPGDGVYNDVRLQALNHAACVTHAPASYWGHTLE